MKTVLIENCVIPGGLATSGMVLVYLPLCDGEGRQVVSGLSERFLKISNKYGPAEIPAEWRKGGKGNRLQAYFSPASFVLALDEMLTEHGIDLWFDTKSSVRKNGRLPVELDSGSQQKRNRKNRGGSIR